MIPQQPQTILTPFCYAGDTRNIPVTTPAGTNQFSYEAGFPPLTSTPLQSGGVPPERQDFNAAFKLLSEFIYYLQSGNKFVWSNLLDYDKGCTILGSDGALYLCIQANGATSPNTVQDPTSSTGYWVKVIDSQGILNINVIGDGTITGSKLANDTITSTQIAANAITSSELADNAVDSAAIAASAVTDEKITSVAASKVTGLSTIAISGSYNDLSNKPTIPTNFPPRPVKDTGTVLGVWKGTFGFRGNYVLPAGGTWAYFVTYYQNSSTFPIQASVCGVDSGGTQIINYGNAVYSALLWRIQ